MGQITQNYYIIYINLEAIEMVKYHIVAVIGGENRWKGGMCLITDILPKAQPEMI